MKLDINQVRANVGKATIEDLLDRITVYRAGMEPEAIELIEAELWRRGVGEDAIHRHEESRSEAMRSEDGCAYRCCRCQVPAVVRRWGWIKLWGWLPITPWYFRYCRDHSVI